MEVKFEMKKLITAILVISCIAFFGIAGCEYKGGLPPVEVEKNQDTEQNGEKIEITSPEIEKFKAELVLLNNVDSVYIGKLVENGISKRIEIDIIIFTGYSDEDVTEVFYKICDSLNSTPSGLRDIVINDKGKYIDVLLSFISSGEVKYKMLNTINQELADRRGLNNSKPEWYSIVVPEGERPFSFLYADAANKKIQLESGKTIKIGDIDIFNMDDIVAMNDILGFSVEDKLNYIYTIYDPEEISALFQGIWMQCCLYGYYDFGYVRYNPNSYYVTWFTIDNPQYRGPRDTAIGDNYQDVIAKFPVDDIDEYDETLKVRTLYGSSYDAPGGIIFYDEEGNISTIRYCALGEQSYYLNYLIENDVIKTISMGLMYDD
jgi:predicted small lipoprotein YifL